MPKDKMVKWNFRAYHITPTEKSNKHENITIPEFKYKNKEKFIPLHANEASSKALHSVSNALAVSFDVLEPVPRAWLENENDSTDSKPELPNILLNGKPDPEQVENAQLQVLKYYNHLKIKMNDILEANPWLMGGLYRAGSNTFLRISSNKANPLNFINEYVDPRLFAKLSDDHFDKNAANESKSQSEPSTSRSSSSNSNRKLTDKEKARIFDQFVTPQAIEVLEDDNKKLASFSIIRDTKDISNMTKMYIIVSINHIIGDASTLFSIFNMLNSDREAKPLIGGRKIFVSYF